MVGVAVLSGCGRINFDPEVTRYLSIAAQGQHTCAVLPDRSVWCWGRNQEGQLGTGTMSLHEAPQQVLGLPPIASVVVGEFSTFALDEIGHVWAWGLNDYGQLGLGMESAGEPTPREVAIDNVVQIASGQYTACVRRGDATVWCTGNNVCGLFGAGGGPNTSTFTQVMGVPRSLEIAMDDDSVCSLDTAGGMTCWGSLMGSGSSTCPGPLLPLTSIPIEPLAHIDGGCHETMCGVAQSGTAYCVGYNDTGAVGDGTMTSTGTWTRVSTLTNATIISSGPDNSCAITADHRVYCWGMNDLGQLGVGDASITSELVPTAVPFFNGSIDLTAIEVGCKHVCASSGSDLYCWGDNRSFALGNGNGTNQYAPVHIDIGP